MCGHLSNTLRSNKRNENTGRDNAAQRSHLRDSFSLAPFGDFGTQEEPGWKTEIQVLCGLYSPKFCNNVLFLPPTILEETTSALYGSRHFSVRNCYSGFWQFHINEEHKERSGFTVPLLHYEIGCTSGCLTALRISYTHIHHTHKKHAHTHTYIHHTHTHMHHTKT